MRLTINDVDPCFNNAIAKCVHETNAESKADTLTILIQDADKKMSSLMFRQNDVIRIDNGTITTGDMFIHKCNPSGNYYEIKAMSIPVSGTVKKSMSWQHVRLLQILKQKADEMGLTLSCYDVDNVAYEFVPQENETDMHFVLKLCERESLQAIVFDRRLIVYNEYEIESKEPGGSIILYDTDEYTYSDESYNMFKSCVIAGGGYSASFSDVDAKTSNVLSKIETYVESDSQSLRFAKGYLRAANKNAKHGTFVMPIDKRFSAGSVCYLNKSGVNDKKIMLTKVRYDYKNEKMKVFFRDIFLEGY